MTNSALRRCSLNQATIEHADIATAIDAAVKADIPAIGLWRRQIEDTGTQQTVAMLETSGLQVTSLCRGGFFTQADDHGWHEALDDNRRAIELAEAVGATELILVPGGISPGGVISDARKRVRESVESLVDDASAAGVRLALEPMHPVFAEDRGVVSTLGQALDLVADLPSSVAGVVVDAYHLWWDADLPHQIARADREGRIGVVQVADWQGVIDGDALRSRTIPGEGCIDFGWFAALIDQTLFDGFIECEVFNAALWREDPYRVAQSVARAHQQLIAPALRAEG